MNKVLKIVVGLAGAAILSAAGGFGWASMKVESRLSQKFESHRLDLPVPFPLSESELEALRKERAPAPAEGQPADPAAAPPDPLAGVDLAKVATDRAIERGRHLVEARYGCTVCHGGNFAGGTMVDDGAIGTIKGPNITTGKGGVTAKYTAADWDRIVRHGIKPDGTPALMPSEDFFRMSDRELSDVIAFVSSAKPVDAVVPAPTLGPIGKVLMATGKFPISAENHLDHKKPHVAEAPEPAETKEFGEHLAAICTGCHNANLAGGKMAFGPPDWPEAANLTQHETGLKGWTYEDFEKVLTTGVKKDGTKLRAPMSEMMPYAQKMTAIEKKALWVYLGSLAPRGKNQ
ncbi:MAG: cytochrome c [Deltaproteobacteria bacterium]|nr:cytochrome c [Deltaproteobacteria bacterium]